MKEDAFIRTLLSHVPHAETPQGPGDDAAVLSPRGRVLSADALVEDVHFIRSHPPEWLGWKALAVNLSDVNAMGATPEAFAFTAALPHDTPSSWWVRFAKGMGEYASRTQTILVGGDIVRSPGPICLSITAWGNYESEQLLRRDQLKHGDRLMLAGTVGASGCGLKAWLKHNHSSFWEESLPNVSDEVLAHLRPSPPLWAGAKALSLGARCGIDLSDGIATDLGHLATASGLTLVIDVEKLPLSSTSRTLAIETVLGFGEDYNLVVGVTPKLTHEFEALGFVDIGRAVTGDAAVRYERAQQPLELQTASFEHFED